jgi:lipid-A-disaccharide synthase
LEIFGIGGDKMRQQGMKLLYHINEMSVLGFGDVIKRFPFFRKVYSALVATLKEIKPDLLILIDYPGMNLKLAKAAKKLGIKVFYYIAPQVWAWNNGRIKKMVKLVDKLAAIIPFEEQMFRRAGIDAHFVGHPLLEVLSIKQEQEEFFRTNKLNGNQKIIGLLPGSRTTEIHRLLPEMVNTVKVLKNRYPNLQVIVSRAPSVEKSFYDKIIDGNSSIKLLENSTYEIMKFADLLIVASGTATLESALFETPLIIVYKVDSLSYFIGKRLVTIENIGLVNVIAEQQIVPEFIQHDFTTNKLLPIIEKMLFDEDDRQKTISHLKKIKGKLGQPGASEKAAKMALSMI